MVEGRGGGGGRGPLVVGGPGRDPPISLIGTGDADAPLGGGGGGHQGRAQLE